MLHRTRIHSPFSPCAVGAHAAPLTFALLWSSGFIVAKYAAPDADPFTFLSVRCGSTIVVLLLIIVASRAPWPASAHEASHSIVAGMLLHGGYLGGVWWAVAQGLPAGIAGLITAGQPLLTASPCRAAPGRAAQPPTVGRDRQRLGRHRARARAAPDRGRHDCARRRRAADDRQFRGHGLGHAGHLLSEALCPPHRSAHRHLPAIRRRAGACSSSAVGSWRRSRC